MGLERSRMDSKAFQPSTYDISIEECGFGEDLLFLREDYFGRGGLCHLINQVGYFTLMRESSYDLFGEYLLAIYDNIKNAIIPRDEIRLQAEGIVQLLRHTGGFRFIISAYTIMNVNFHVVSPFDIMQIIAVSFNAH